MRRPGPSWLTGIVPALIFVTPLDAPGQDDQGETLGLTEMAQRMTVPVEIDGRGPFNFVVDTGAERTVVSRQLANRLALIPGPVVTVHSMTEVSQIGTVQIAGLKVGRRTVSDIHAPALDHGNLGASGMLGVDGLRSQRVVFDFARHQITITPSRRRERPWPGGTVQIKGREHFGRLMLGDASVEGQAVLVIIDTGSQITIANSALRRALERRRRLGATVPIQLRSITGGRMMADYGVAKRVRLGDVRMENLPISFADVHPFRQLQLTERPALLLGMDALQLFARVSVDVPNRRARLLLPGAHAGQGIDVVSLDPAGGRLTD